MSNFLSVLFYSFPDAVQTALNQARSFNDAIQTATPHSYHGQSTGAAVAGSLDSVYINLIDFDYTTNIQAKKRLFFGDLYITCALYDEPVPNTGLSINVGSFLSDGALATPYGHQVFYSDKNYSMGQLDKAQALTFFVPSVWTYGVSFDLTSDAGGYLAANCSVTFNGLKFT